MSISSINLAEPVCASSSAAASWFTSVSICSGFNCVSLVNTSLLASSLFITFNLNISCSDIFTFAANLFNLFSSFSNNSLDVLSGLPTG